MIDFSPSAIVYAVLAIGVCSWLISRFHHKGDLFYVDNEENRRRISKCKHLLDPQYKQTPWLFNAYVQGFFAVQLPYKNKRLVWETEKMKLPNGGVIHLDWSNLHCPTAKKIHEKTIAVILPGVSGGKHSGYIRYVAVAGHRKGFEKIVVSNLRWGSDGLYIGETGSFSMFVDFHLSMIELRKRYPDYTFVAIGHSYGGNLITKYLGEYRGQHPFVAAVSVCNPFSFTLALPHLLRNLSDKFMCETVKSLIRKQEKCVRKHKLVDYDKIMKARNTEEVEDLSTARLYGYSGVKEYHEAISSAPWVPKIDTPILFICALDDPICNHETVKLAKDCVSKCPSSILLTTPAGGHVGWFEGWLRPVRWYTKPAYEYLEAVLEEHKK